MKEYALSNKFLENSSPPWMDLDQYYSVEIAISGLGIIYQFRIWQIESSLSFILVKENSAILPWLNTGDRVNMKYYSSDLKYPYQNLDTEIRAIDKQDTGRLRGHFLVGLEIIEDKHIYCDPGVYRKDNTDLLRLL